MFIDHLYFFFGKLSIHTLCFPLEHAPFLTDFVRTTCIGGTFCLHLKTLEVGFQVYVLLGILGYVQQKVSGLFLQKKNKRFEGIFGRSQHHWNSWETGL